MIRRLERRLGRRLGTALAFVALLFATACAEVAPMDYLRPEGPIARQEDGLFKPVFWIATVIFFLVEGALVYAVFRYRRRRETDIPEQTHGNKRMEIAWTLAPAVLLMGVAVPTVATIFTLSEKPAAAGSALQVKLTAHQWWWRYEYQQFTVPGTKEKLETANELHIPVGRPVSLEMTSQDVIHAFWVPKLAGKQDVIPGRVTYLTIEADRPGEYLGQCAEFCALSHANMRLRVIAQTQDDFDRWVRDQLSPASTAAQAAEGAGLFLGAGTCWQCHTVRGLEIGGKKAQGVAGPDLTHVASRGTFGGALFPFDEESLRAWLRDPQAVKPGNRMVVPDLSEQQITLLIAFLQSLR